MVAGQPDDLDLVGQLSQQRQNLPVVLVEAAEVDRVEDVAIEDEPWSNEFALDDSLEEFTDSLGFTVAASQMEIRKDDRVQPE